MKNIIMYVEGATDKEFYEKLIEHLRNKLPTKRFNNCKVSIVPIGGIGNYSNKLLGKYKREIMEQHKNEENIVFLCYDEDVFVHGVHPPINRDKITKKLKEYHATKVIHLKASKSIEDWIMLDIEGALNYLKLPKKTKITGATGLIKIKNLFKKVNRIYIKGTRVNGLIESLDMELICNKLCDNLSILCIELGCTCQTCLEKQKKSLLKI